MSINELAVVKDRMVGALAIGNTRRVTSSFKEVVENGIWAEEFEGYDFSTFSSALVPVLKQVTDQSDWKETKGFSIAGPWLQRLGSELSRETIDWAIELAIKQHEPLSMEDIKITAEFCRRNGNCEALYQVFIKLEQEVSALISDGVAA